MNIWAWRLKFDKLGTHLLLETENSFSWLCTVTAINMVSKYFMIKHHNFRKAQNRCLLYVMMTPAFVTGWLTCVIHIQFQTQTSQNHVLKLN